jgi:hypothetical protein
MVRQFLYEEENFLAHIITRHSMCVIRSHLKNTLGGELAEVNQMKIN